MKRRQFISGAAAGSAVAMASTISAPAVSKGLRELRLITSFPRNYPALGTSPKRVAERITAATDGKLQIKMFGAGELVPAFQVFDVVSQGDADMYFSVEYYFQGKSPAFNFFTTVPYGLTGPEMAAWVYYGGGQELWDELSGNFGLKPFLGPNTGVQMGGWLNKEINGFDDLKGLKFRMPGIGGQVMRALGVTVVNLPGSEIFAALQSGAIDGTEWTGPWFDLAFGFQKISKYYYWPGFHEPGSTGSYVFNRSVWESFTKEQQLICQMAIEAEAQIQSAEFDMRNLEALDVMINKHGVKLRRYSDDILNAFGRISGEVVREIGNSDPMTKRVYESYMNYRKRSIAWSKYGLHAYLNARALPFKYG